MGGRGAKSKNRIVGMPKNKKKAIKSLKNQIQKHRDKINQAIKTGKGAESINHLEDEIRAFEKDIENKERRYRKK